MNSLQEAQERYQRRLVNINWYVFGLMALLLGFAFISGNAVWFILSIPFIWAFGVCSAAVIGGNLILRRFEENNEEEQ